ncbi:unnamed protein product [Gongylonema pulchrum]|uniref:Uncharacterized protein n=1 Tax=Gongylonema pulchrum TaxID=637853 RepID=A0A3P7N236_9BILA|nr:unnamed protein product [Gongylonema pulchrum]
MHLKSLLDIGLCIAAAYGSNKDVSVYNGAGVKSNRIFSVAGGKRKGGCTHIDSYASHLTDLNNGVYDFAQPFDSSLVFHHINSVNLSNRSKDKEALTFCSTYRFS